MENEVSSNSWLLCRPQYFDVTYEINPWMNKQRVPEKAKAAAQWQHLHDTLQKLGVDLRFVEPGQQVPDMVFTANAGLVRNNVCVMAHFKHPERQGEEPLFQAWFEKHGFTTHTLSRFFEGEGDALFAGDNLFYGYGFRSEVKAAEEVGKLLSVSDLIVAELVDGRFYHLDTCFCPLNAQQAIFFPPAFSPDGRKRLEKHIELIAIPEVDALKFACNALVLDKKVVLPAGCAGTEKILAERGFESFGVELSEFMKAGGAAKCLSLRLEQVRG